MQDQLMTVKQLAEYLNLNERTVLKLVQDGQLPGVKIGNQWRFRRPMIDTWLDDQMLGITPQYVQPIKPSAARLMLSLENCCGPENIVAQLNGVTKTSVIVELAAHAEQQHLVTDQTWFVGALFQRESVMPTALGNGVAVLHTLRRHPERIMEPFLVVGRSQEGVDFDSLDGLPTHLFFVLGLRYEELHLPWLSKLMHMLAQPEMRPALLDAQGPEEIYDILLSAERTLHPGITGTAT